MTYCVNGKQLQLTKGKEERFPMVPCVKPRERKSFVMDLDEGDLILLCGIDMNERVKGLKCHEA